MRPDNGRSDSARSENSRAENALSEKRRILKAIGQQLFNGREQAQITIDQLAEKTRITDKFIIAMEQGEFDELPGRVFARGFITNICRETNIDALPLIEAFNSVLQIESKLPNLDLSSPRETQGSSSKGSSSKGSSGKVAYSKGSNLSRLSLKKQLPRTAIFGILAGILLIWGITSLFSRMQVKTISASQDSSVANTTSKSSDQNVQIQSNIAGSGENSAFDPTGELPLKPTDADGAVDEQVTLETDTGGSSNAKKTESAVQPIRQDSEQTLATTNTNSTPIEATHESSSKSGVPSLQSKPDSTATVSNFGATTQKQETPAAPANTSLVEFDVNQPVIIRYRCDGGEYKSQSFEVKVHSLKFNEECEIYVNNTSSVSLKLNGHMISPRNNENRARKFTVRNTAKM